uniref:Uncharacterized protein n=1 Tax=Rhizophora mucronata TaxID=61149 RepID=A0A2P2QZL7_RHIMU
MFHLNFFYNCRVFQLFEKQ